MRRLDYRGVLESWKVDVIIARAKQMGFRGSNLDDVQQEIILKAMRFRFDAAKSNGAMESTAFIAVIDNYLKEMIRSETRYRLHLEQMRATLKESYDPTPTDHKFLDIQGAIAVLSPREQDVCNLLGLGYSIHEIAKMRVWGWHTVERLIDNIREKFEEAGIRGWVHD